jgi:peroxiredoxin
VGSPAPKFSLPDAEGTLVALDDLVAHGPVVVVFLRGFA